MQAEQTAYFVEDPRTVMDLKKPHPIEAERPYRIVKQVALPAIDYENFITDMTVDRPFLEDVETGGTGPGAAACILVRQDGQAEGVLVVPRGAFVAWAAYLAPVISQ